MVVVVVVVIVVAAVPELEAASECGGDSCICGKGGDVDDDAGDANCCRLGNEQEWGRMEARCEEELEKWREREACWPVDMEAADAIRASEKISSTTAVGDSSFRSRKGSGGAKKLFGSAPIPNSPIVDNPASLVLPFRLISPGE